MDTRKLIVTGEVVEALDEELAYQATLADQGRSDKVHYGLPGQLLTLKEYTDKAIAAWVTNPGDSKALHVLRKCAAIAVRGMLTEGVKRRYG